MSLRFIYFFIFSFTVSDSLWADCTNSEKGVPGRSGQIQYNLINSEYEYCDFNNWRSLKYDQAITNFTSIYSTDFESGVVAGEWGFDFINNFTSFLGRFGSTGNTQGPAKVFNLSGSQDSTRITFDLYDIDNWNGRSVILYIDDVEINRFTGNNHYTALSNGSNGNVSWTVESLIPIRYNFGFGTSSDQKHRLVVSITNPAATTIKLGFGSDFIGGAALDAFGIDNLIIEEIVSGTPSVILSDDFESGVPANDWGASFFLAESSKFLGQYSNSASLALLSRTINLMGPPIDSTTIEFDFLEIDSFDNEPFNVYIDDVLVYTFNFNGSNTYDTPPDGSNGNVSWTVVENEPYPVELAGSTRWPEQTYHYTFTYTNPGSSQVKIAFGASLDAGIGDESWGIDNVSVSTFIGGTPTLQYSQDFEGVVPSNEFVPDNNFAFGSFLGPLGNTGGTQGAHKTLSLPGGQTTTTLTFDVYEIDSWDNEPFTLFINDNAVFSHSFTHLFYNKPTSGSNGIYSWTVSNLTSIAYNFGMGPDRDQAYRYVVTINNNGATSVKIGFGAIFNSGIANESLGIDNIIVEHNFSGGAVVYNDDFDDGRAELRWNNVTASTSAFSKFLGLGSGTGGAQGLNRTFALSGSQDTTTLVFDIYEIDSWDSEVFRVFVNDVLIFSETWSHLIFETPSTGSNGTVSWTGANLTYQVYNMGGPSSGHSDQAYRYTLTVSNPGATSVKIGFGSTLNGATSDESWGVDNFYVIENSGGGDTEIYYDDFEALVSGWSNNTTYSSYGIAQASSLLTIGTGSTINTPFTQNETSSSTFNWVRTKTSNGGALTTALGSFNSTARGQGPSRVFVLPGTQSETKIELDLIYIGSWDSEPIYIFINDTVVYNRNWLSTSYTVDRKGTSGAVSWRANNVTPSPAGSYGSWPGSEQSIKLTFYVQNPGATEIKLGFGSDVDGGDEDFAIDNVKVSHYNTSPFPNLGACSDPGKMQYDSINKAIVFCNGTNLWPMGPPNSGVGGCAGVGIVEGEMDYSAALWSYQYCDGNGWVTIDN